MQVQPLLAAPECALRRTTGTMWAVISHIEPDRAYLVRCACKAVKHFAGDIYRIAIYKGAAFRSNGAAEGARPPYCKVAPCCVGGAASPTNDDKACEKQEPHMLL